MGKKPAENPIRRIDVLMPSSNSAYGVQLAFTKGVYAALNRMGYDCRLLDVDENFLFKLRSDPPDFTLAFNGQVVLEKGLFLCDFLKKPHVSMIIDPAFHFFDLAKSNLNVIACNDRFSYEGLNFLPDVHRLFLPHATDQEITHDAKQERPIDVLSITTFIDMNEMISEFRDVFTEAQLEMLDHVAEESLKSQSLSFIEAYTQSPGASQIAPEHQFEALYVLEMMVRAKDRIRLLDTFKHATVAVVAPKNADTSWRKLFKGRRNFTFIDQVDYEHHFDLLRQSKVVLNSSPHVKQGGHERVFDALLCGAVPLTSENPFMAEFYKDGDSLLFYRHNNIRVVEQKVLNLLDDEKLRKAIANKGETITRQYHTWDIRMKTLIDYMLAAKF